MRFFFLLLFLIAASASLAIDVDASKKVVPDHFVDPGGSSHFSIFAGDPKRIQKANTINFNDFEKKIEVTPVSLSLKQANTLAGQPAIKIVYTLKNNGKKTYILSFPNAQRYDILVRDSTGQSIYTWSADKEFTQETGTILVNNGDKITFTEDITMSDFITPPAPGAYTVEAVTSNYPELHAKTQLTVTP